MVLLLEISCENCDRGPRSRLKVKSVTLNDDIYQFEVKLLIFAEDQAMF